MDNDDGEKNSSPESAATAEVQHGGVYRIPLDWEPTNLDPAYIEDDFAISVAYQLYDGLVRYGPYLNILPALAKDWQIEKQGRVLRFHLREDATFHDGMPVTAQDAVFSLQRLFRINPEPSILSHLLYIAGSEA
jgi:ABC-type transport system substrate-binding protein